MESEAQIVFKKIIERILFQNQDLKDLESFLSHAVRSLYYEYIDHIIEWTSSFTKIKDGATTQADTLMFQSHRVVVAYSYPLERANLVNVVVALMKDFPKPNLSIKKALFMYDCRSKTFVKIDTEIPRH